MKLSAQPGVPRRIASQLVDAETSIAANYEEAIAVYSRRDFKAKRSIVLKEARESRLWLRVISANRLARPEELDPLLKESNELVAIFTASMKRFARKTSRRPSSQSPESLSPGTCSNGSFDPDAVLSQTFTHTSGHSFFRTSNF
jgi:four helix bundle protein